MTKPNLQSAWIFRQEKIDRIHEMFDQFPEMDDRTGDLLANCLTALMRGHDLSPDQESAYRWWNAWLKRRHQGCFASIVGVSLSVRDLPVVVYDELMEARHRLRCGEDMTSRQAALWGHHVVKRWDAESRRRLRKWSRDRPSFRQRH